MRDTYPQIVKEYVDTGKLRYVLLDLPLESIHKKAFKAAEATRCANDQGKYWEMHDKLIENSPDLDHGHLVKYANEIGLDMNRFVSDLDGMKHKEQIEKDVELATALDFYNTPTFVINGRVVIGNRPYKYLKKIVEEELANAGK